MASAMNKVFLLGNLGADPELRHSRKGDPFIKLRVATNERWKDRDSGEIQERVEWHWVVLWGNRAEPLSRILQKGDRVMIEGQIRTSSYDKEGQTHYFTEVRARDLYLAGTPRRRRRDDEEEVIVVEEEEMAHTMPSSPPPLPPQPHLSA